jgi:pyridoxamine 5'-phosphate oxidase
MADWIEQTDPLQLFQDWFDKASQSEPNDPNAMALATVDDKGLPDVRIVLLKGVNERGFVFYTNLNSAKGQHLRHNPQAALCFYWKSLGRQIRIRGQIQKVSDCEADAYYASRPRGSQIGAWASDQSHSLASRDHLEERIEHFTKLYDGQDIPRPPHWSGFCLEPQIIEFWEAGEYRLHDRIIFEAIKTSETQDMKDFSWNKTRLYP